MRRAAFLKTTAFMIALASAYGLPALAFDTKPYDAETFKAAQSAGKPVLIDIFAPWCPTCKAQHQVFESLQGKPEFAGVTILKVDYDTQTEALKFFKAQRQSTLIAFKGANETGRSVGDTKPESIEALLTSTLK